MARRIRIIPTLLLDRRGRLVKTVRFGKRTYIGDPINAVKVFNRKQVDELVLFDIDASRDGRPPNYAQLADIASEAFMPVSYGGGIMTLEQVEMVFRSGVDKVVISTALATSPALITEIAERFGSQSVTVCLQVRRGWLGGAGVHVCSGRRRLPGPAAVVARDIAARGAGEVIVYNIDRDGSWQGYDTALLRRVSDAVDVPVVACGGARNLSDFVAAVEIGGCSAVAAGSLFLYQSAVRGVLISYPSPEELQINVYDRLA
jgi:imidazole glycerol-phosphate synthase subunit HisF